MIFCETHYKITWQEADGFYCAELDCMTDFTINSQKRKANSFEVLETEVGIEGAIPHNIIEISAEEAKRLHNKLSTPTHIETIFPKEIAIASKEELSILRAEAIYSDGTTAKKEIQWDDAGIDWTKEGVYKVKGSLKQTHFPFPLAYNRADPCVGKWNQKYYFIATNDADHNHTLYIREADTLEGLKTSKEHLILDTSTYEEIGGLLWAPEFHIINNRLYIFHAATTGEFFWEESHIMELRPGGEPTCKSDWSRPRRIVKMDGTDICEAGKEITLDMTCFEWENELYAIWSQRQFLPKDLGAWLYIAKLNEKTPWKLASEPVILSKPE